MIEKCYILGECVLILIVINTYMRRIAIFLFVATFSSLAAAESPRYLPGPNMPFAIGWKTAATSPISEDFIIKEHRLYTFSIAFRLVTPNPSSDDRKKLRTFAGDGSYYRVTRESAETEQPVHVPEYSEEEEAFLKKGGSLVGGDYFKTHPLKPNEKIHEPPAGTVLVLTPAGKGKIIPIHLHIDEIGEDGDVVATRFDQSIKTEGIVSGGQFGMKREIINIRLLPGRYRVTANMIESVFIPDYIETLLIGGWDPRINPEG